MRFFGKAFGILLLIMFITGNAILFLAYTVRKINTFRDESYRVVRLITSWDRVINSINELILTDHSHLEKKAIWEVSCENFNAIVRETTRAEKLQQLSAGLAEILDDIFSFSLSIDSKIGEIDAILAALDEKGFFDGLGDKQIGILALDPEDSGLPSSVQVNLWNLNYTWLNFTASGGFLTAKLERLSEISKTDINSRIRQTYCVSILIIAAIFMLTLFLFLFLLRRNKTIENEKNRIRLYFTDLINSMPSMVIGLDDQNYVTLWNTEAEKMTGMNEAECRGKPVQRCIPFITEHLIEIDEVKEKGKTRSLSKVRDNAGEIYDILLFPLANNGKVDTILRIDNVSEKVRLENIMIQTEKILAVGGLAAGMAHEINNPLAGIIQNIQNAKRRLLSRDVKQNLKTAAECGIDFNSLTEYLQRRGLYEILDMIYDSSKRAARIIQNTLKFSRQSDFEFKEHDLRSLVENALDLAMNDYNLIKKYDFKNITIRRDFDKHLPPVFCADIEIEQVFLNLFVNAAHAFQEVDRRTKDPGYRPMITIRTYREMEMVCADIEDNGPGLDDNAVRRLFEPFYTTKTPGSGTGLGLSVSYTIITTRHNGSMEAESKPGAGTKFRIRLHAARQE